MTAPPIPAAPVKANWGQQAAKFSLYAPLVAIVLGIVGTRVPNTNSRAFIGFFNLALLLCGFLAGIVALASISRFGKKGILIRAILGILFNGLILTAAVSLFWFTPVRMMNNRAVGNWAAKVPVTPGHNVTVTLKLRPDHTGDFSLAPEHSQTVKWEILQDKTKGFFLRVSAPNVDPQDWTCGFSNAGNTLTLESGTSMDFMRQ